MDGAESENPGLERGSTMLPSGRRIRVARKAVTNSCDCFFYAVTVHAGSFGQPGFEGRTLRAASDSMRTPRGELAGKRAKR